LTFRPLLAFSNEASSGLDTGSREENASKQEIGVSGQAASKTAGNEIASWRMIRSPVQEATEPKLAAAIVFGQAHNFLGHWPGKMPDLARD
jgi:hypothetical protein